MAVVSLSFEKKMPSLRHKKSFLKKLNILYNIKYFTWKYITLEKFTDIRGFFPSSMF